MIVEEKANKYAEETILALYSDSELMQDFVQKQKKYAKVDFIAGYNEGQSNPKVKQLEWEEGGLRFRSITKFGEYTISKPNSLRDRQVFGVYFNDIYIKSWNIPKEAKAFAQSDFEARIKECLITE